MDKENPSATYNNSEFLSNSDSMNAQKLMSGKNWDTRKSLYVCRFKYQHLTSVRSANQIINFTIIIIKINNN